MRRKRLDFLNATDTAECLGRKSALRGRYVNSFIKNLVLLLVCIPLSHIVTGQPTHLKFTSLTSRDGLLSNSVNAILKDSHGLMWFATDDGLNKFDGTNFTVYRHIAGDSSSLRANEILALHEDRNGNLWVGTSGGAVSCYDRTKDRFVSYPASGNIQGFTPTVVIRGICSDYAGKIWLAEYSAVYTLDPSTGRISRLDLNPAAESQPQAMVTYCVFEDSHHVIWVGTNHGLFMYIKEKNAFRQFRHSDSDSSSLVNDQVNAIAEDKRGNLWVGTGKGLCMMHAGGNNFTSYSQISNTNLILGNQYINAISTDNDGLLWVGTMQGLHIINPQTGHSASYRPEYGNAYSLTSSAIRSIYIDKEGIYWVGTYQGGINKYDKNLNLFDGMLGDAFRETGPRSSVVTSFAENAGGNLFVGTDGGGLYQFNQGTAKLQPVEIVPKSLNIPSLSVLALKMSGKGKLYVGTYANGLFIYDPVTHHTERLQAGPNAGDIGGNDIFSIMEDSKGQIWIGTNGAGVNVLVNNKVVAKYTPAPTKPGETQLPINGYIRAFAEDAEGNIWIGCHGSGVAVYNPNTKQFQVYRQNNSNLPGDKVQCLMLDHTGNMWVGSYGGGLSLFDKKNKRFINFTEKDGLQNATVYQIVEDALGHIWVSTNTGISSFDVSKRFFRNYNHSNGLQNNNFVHASGIRTSTGELFFGGLQGFNYFNPAQLTTNKNVPGVIITDLKVANKSVIPADDAPIKQHISVASEIRLDYKQNFAVSFVALNYTIARQNHYAYMLEGFDKDWVYNSPVNTAYYTNLDPGTYTFRVKAANNDGVWSAVAASVTIYVKPPFWLTVYAYIFYAISIGGLLLYSRYRGLKRLRKKFQADQEKMELNRVQELDRLKLKFLTNLSHEFRTPISLIMGPVDQLLSEQENNNSRQKLGMIKRNARRLLNLVNQLLDFRKMEEQELKLQLSQTELVSFIKDISFSFTDLSERKNIKFSFECKIDRLYADVDRDKLERILFNLLSNAFKFTLAGGSITVSMKLTNDVADAALQWVLIQVADTGIGIEADKKEKIFERFFQNITTTALLNQGSGIGLSITQEFVKMHGGTISIDSEVGKGSVFSVSLPVRLAQSMPVNENQLQTTANGIDVTQKAIAAREKAELNGDRPTILVVEDNEDFRFYLKDNLRHLYQVIEASDGEEGWKQALSSHPQLIVSDINMPRMDGIALIQKLKADPRTNHIPVILLTAMLGDKQQLDGLGMGAIDYITKPFNFEVLSAKIKNMLALSDKLKATYTRQIKVLAPETEIESEDEKLLNRVVTYLEENIMNPQLSVEVLSHELGMSRSSLYSKMLKITGQKPVEYIRSFKLDKAAILLQKSGHNVAEVAYMTGFSAPTYFARAFKAKFGVHPSSYAATVKAVTENKGIKMN